MSKRGRGQLRPFLRFITKQVEFGGSIVEVANREG